MRIHHLNCGTMCPYGGSLFGGEGSPLAETEMVCHCLLIEAGDSLALIDTGYGTADVRDPHGNLGRPVTAVFRPRGDLAETAVEQIRGLDLDRPSSARSPSPTSTSTTPAVCPTSPRPRSTSSPPSARPR